MAKLTISCIVRRFCLECQGNSSKAVRECADEHCALWEHRLPPHTANSQGELIPHGKVEEQSAEEPNPVSPLRPTKEEDTGDIRQAENMEGLEEAVPSAATNNRPDTKAREAARRLILRAVRRHCLTCAACRADVRTCAARECGLWSYRFGVYPETYRAVRQRFTRPKTLSLF